MSGPVILFLLGVLLEKLFGDDLHPEKVGGASLVLRVLVFLCFLGAALWILAYGILAIFS